MNSDKDQLYAELLDGDWVKSSFSNGSGNDCVQLMALNGGVAMADSKAPDLPPHRYTRSEFAAFIAGVKAGEFDRFIEE
ncbi:DUF397 domain-containing protein [Streptomyces sp. RFCAC02]|uniref:DUF397 domain-containing protein n=1 Tax=Streptomyces sp. RFCAC02 TaxID=2499143 RepID=UPI00102081D2|nr:DUF397 domain-containing protein [Streptomyces sp. RFCAC02]